HSEGDLVTAASQRDGASHSRLRRRECNRLASLLTRTAPLRVVRRPGSTPSRPPRTRLRVLVDTHGAGKSAYITLPGSRGATTPCMCALDGSPGAATMPQGDPFAGRTRMPHVSRRSL